MSNQISEKSINRLNNKIKFFAFGIFIFTIIICVTLIISFYANPVIKTNIVDKPDLKTPSSQIINSNSYEIEIQKGAIYVEYEINGEIQETHTFFSRKAKIENLPKGEIIIKVHKLSNFLLVGFASEEYEVVSLKVDF